MQTEKRLALIREVGEEIITEQDLVELLQRKKRPVAYDGFEPSGKIHIAQGILRAINVNKMARAGCRFKLLVADWHALANNKLGGKMGDIQVAGEYIVEVWKQCGMDLKNVEFVWASDLVKQKGYWEKVMGVATRSTVNRIIRTSQIMGRTEQETLHASQVFYPCMQVADIFQLEADIAQLGMDQRKVNVLARELGERLGYWKPVAVHHHMVLGLTVQKTSSAGIERKIELKMSKTNPDAAIFMTDSEEEIKRKIMHAYCPEKELEENPVIEYCKFLVFEKFKEMKIERNKKFGGDLSLKSFSELEDEFSSGGLHPMDLKNATAFYINKMVEPVRKHFQKDRKARGLLERVNAIDPTKPCT